jgi:hypothetical protein
MAKNIKAFIYNKGGETLVLCSTKVSIPNGTSSGVVGDIENFTEFDIKDHAFVERIVMSDDAVWAVVEKCLLFDKRIDREDIALMERSFHLFEGFVETNMRIMIDNGGLIINICDQ